MWLSPHPKLYNSWEGPLAATQDPHDLKLPTYSLYISLYIPPIIYAIGSHYKPLSNQGAGPSKPPKAGTYFTVRLQRRNGQAHVQAANAFLWDV